eukprot:scaffold67372_cov26-Cyclotella_meneghiniana.AAC.2
MLAVSIVFHFHKIGLWKKKDMNMLRLDSGSPQINPEMIDWYVRGEQRMDSYIHYRLNSATLTEAEQVKDAQLLRRIEPTSDTRKSQNKTNVIRAVSTDSDTVANSYYQRDKARE